MPLPKFHGIFSSIPGDPSTPLPTSPSGLRGAGRASPSTSSAIFGQAGQGRDTVSVGGEGWGGRGAGQIAVDIYEDGGHLVIKAPIAGVRISDLDIDVADNVITIRGERRQCDEIEAGQYIVQECYFGEFSRRIELPHSVNPSRVKATLSKDGILKVFVPREERKVKIVKINEGG